MTDLQNLKEECRELMKEIRKTQVSSSEYMFYARKLLDKRKEIMNHPDRNEA